MPAHDVLLHHQAEKKLRQRGNDRRRRHLAANWSDKPHARRTFSSARRETGLGNLVLILISTDTEPVRLGL